MSGSFMLAGQQLHRQLAQILAAPVLSSDNDPIDLVLAAHQIRDGAEALMAAAVQQAREAGRTWQDIGQVLGVSRQAAFQRYGKPIDPRNGEVMNTRPLPDAIELARAVIDDHAHGRWPAITERFDETMRAGLTEEGLAEAWAYLAGMAGAYESHGDTDAVRAGDFTITNTPLTFEAGDFVARVTFRDDRTIAGLYILNPDAADGSSKSATT
ncbi:DUF3887 domain-containing protein [Mycolicibacterium vanbaalenii]|nr:DUF3887 domain-containing protein [Mycolicibacterium vanbaalenii]